MACMICAPAFAQDDYAPFEVFGGYDFTRLIYDGGTLNMNGFAVAFTSNFNPTFGIKAELGRVSGSEYDVGSNVFSFVAGPQIATQLSDSARVFGHAMLGFARAGTDLPGVNSESGFAMAFGGGVDWTISDRIAIRAPQFDYMPTKIGKDSTQNNIRILAGIVFRFGN